MRQSKGPKQLSEIKISKLAKQLINKFHYYQTYHCQQTSQNNQQKKIQTEKSSQDTNQSKHYVQKCEKQNESLKIFIHKAQYSQINMQNQKSTDHPIGRNQMIQIIRKSILKAYFKHDAVKIDWKYFKSSRIQINLKMKFFLKTLLNFIDIEQIIQIVALNPQTLQSKEKCIQFFILHHINQQNYNQATQRVDWNNFIQKYTFSDKVIKYQAIGTIHNTKSQYEQILFKELFSLYTNNKYASQLIQNCEKAKSYFYQLQSKTLKQKNGITREIALDPAYSDVHRRVLKLPPQYYEIFSTLKRQFKDTEITENDICRYLFVYDYQQEAARQVLNEFLDFRKQLKLQFNQADYREFQDLDFIKYIGEEFEGRPVILFSARNFKAHEVDLDKFIKQLAYFMQYQIPSKQRGYVDTHVSVIDYQNLSIQNVNLQAVKKSINEGMKYGPQRSYKIFAVNLNTFAYTCYRTLKSLIPDRTLKKLTIVGQDKQQIMDNLLKVMNQQVIPQQFGGKNKIQIK